MSDPAILLDKCRRLGLELWADGDRIGIAPKRSIPPGLLEDIRSAKPILLPLIREGQERRLPADVIPWLHIAKQVLQGEFAAHLDNSHRESLVIGLRNIGHPLCRRALEQLKGNAPQP